MCLDVLRIPRCFWVFQTLEEEIWKGGFGLCGVRSSKSKGGMDEERLNNSV